LVKRNRILQLIANAVKSIPYIKTVEVDRINAVDITKTSLPAIFIYGGNDKSIDDVIGMETWDWEISVEVWAKGKDMEDILADIHKKLHAINGKTGEINTITRTSSEMFVVDPTKLIKGMLLKYSVIYRNPLGDMS